MSVTIVRRADLRDLLETITKDPEQIFGVFCKRRTDVYLRYPPEGNEGQGRLAYAGDHSIWMPGHPDHRKTVYGKRGSEKIILQPAGSIRHMLCKRKFPDAETGEHTPMKHWTPKGGRMPYDPKEKGLFGPVAGMYNDNEKTQPAGGKRMGRFGQWRPWTMIALEGVTTIQNKGETYAVVD